MKTKSKKETKVGFALGGVGELLPLEIRQASTETRVEGLCHKVEKLEKRVKKLEKGMKEKGWIVAKWHTGEPYPFKVINVEP